MVENKIAELSLEMKHIQEELRETEESYIKLQKVGQEENKTRELIQSYQKRLASLMDKLASIEPDSSDEAKMKICRVESELADLQRRLVEQRNRLDELVKEKETLQSRFIETSKNFDKNKLFRNIRELASAKNAKLGQIERRAGCQPGYMSRLEKPGNTTDPSVEFVVTAAKELEVSLDLLIYSDFSKIKPAEAYIIRFVENLIKDTRDDVLFWESENMDEALASAVHDNPDFVFNHPFFEYDVFSGSLWYKSQFFPGSGVTWSGNSYSCRLKGSTAEIFIMRCADGLKKINRGNDYLEIYLVDSNKVNLLFCTAQTGETMISVADRLYEEVETYMSHIHVNEDVKSIIDTYMKSSLGEDHD